MKWFTHGCVCVYLFGVAQNIWFFYFLIVIWKIDKHIKWNCVYDEREREKKCLYTRNVVWHCWTHNQHSNCRLEVVIKILLMSLTDSVRKRWKNSFFSTRRMSMCVRILKVIFLNIVFFSDAQHLYFWHWVYVHIA